MSATDPATVVGEYFARIGAGDTAVAELFHEDGCLVGLGRRTAGREAIRSFYATAIARGSPKPRLVGPLLARGSRVAAEIRIALAGSHGLHVMDLFEVEDGLIRSLTYFVADHPS